MGVLFHNGSVREAAVACDPLSAGPQCAFPFYGDQPLAMPDNFSVYALSIPASRIHKGRHVCLLCADPPMCAVSPCAYQLFSFSNYLILSNFHQGQADTLESSTYLSAFCARNKKSSACRFFKITNFHNGSYQITRLLQVVHSGIFD